MITILLLIKQNWKTILFVFFSILLFSIAILIGWLREVNIEKKRMEENLRQTQLENSTLTLSSNEFREFLHNSEQRTARHVDSLFKANKINPRSVNEVHNITNTYKDTTIVKIAVPKSDIIKPLVVGDKCWGFSGTISNNELVIKERYFVNEIDLVDYAKPKKFLGIRFGWHNPQIEAFSDCGKVTVRTYRKDSR